MDILNPDHVAVVVITDNDGNIRACPVVFDTYEAADRKAAEVARSMKQTAFIMQFPDPRKIANV